MSNNKSLKIRAVLLLSRTTFLIYNYSFARYSLLKEIIVSVLLFYLNSFLPLKPLKNSLIILFTS